MAIYVGEEEVWKCPKHPSKRRRNGICPVCLRDRLVILCPDCANVRPCPCCAPGATSSSSSASSSSSFSFFSSSVRGGGGGRVSELLDREPSFRRSRSVGIPSLFTRFAGDKRSDPRKDTPPPSRIKTPSFWSKFKRTKNKKGGGGEEVEERENEESKENCTNNCHNNDDEGMCRNSSIEDFARMMMKSRSVHVGMMSSSGDGRSSAGKGRWSFPESDEGFPALIQGF